MLLAPIRWRRTIRRLAPVPLGRLARMAGAHLLWPVLALLAAAYRRTVLRRTPVVAVVGSFGKTTTRAAILAALGLPRRRGGSWWAPLALAVLRHPPGSPLVLEVAIDAPGQMRRYARLLRPTVTVVTSIGSEHRLSLGGLATTQREKGEMVAALSPGAVVIGNGDDARVRAMTEARPEGVREVLVGWSAGCVVRGEDAALDWPRGTTLTVVAPAARLPLAVGLIGGNALRSLFAAVAVARELGVDTATAVERLRGFQPRSGRMQIVPLASGAFVLRDDAKSPVETVDDALDVLATIPARRRFVVLGAVTEPEAQNRLYRRLGGRVAAIACRLLVLGSQHRDLSAGARAAGMPSDRVTRHGGVHEIAAVLAAEAGPGDVVLLKGRVDQRLARIALLLGGVNVRCHLATCYARGLTCERCPRLSGYSR